MYLYYVEICANLNKQIFMTNSFVTSFRVITSNRAQTHCDWYTESHHPDGTFYQVTSFCAYDGLSRQRFTRQI